MKNSFGNNVTLTLFGESHGAAIGAVLDGLAAGIPVDEEYIANRLTLRRPALKTDTARKEKDEFSILSGVTGGYTTGSPLAIVIPNTDTRSNDYEATRFLARPSHADFAAHEKFRGFEDYRGGGHFSGRVTAAIAAAGAILLSALNRAGIIIGSHVLRCAGVSDTPFSLYPQEEIKRLQGQSFPVLDDTKREEMISAVSRAAAENDSAGGIIETAVCNVPAGLGNPWFDSVEGVLSHALFSLGGVKGVSFGAGYSLCDMRGSEANDEFYADRNGKISTKTNRNGGVNGGITNGMPVV
ncbi:MAG: chorismate synthase, partial [Candidatus Borkfalkiaceae bacterium]|nr:chorismate synthase [Clostridia bacterium]MDY6223402.1 chorismate synthase [Christensenellaceae bacterium]